ncbi:hypothetical protein B566_EDAN011133 [Ephemera danica]|nr:hypothetical protein B566_EDAN011133 [Ephemera danica]
MYYKPISNQANRALRALKVKPAHVADSLRNLVSFDPELRKKKQLRIVEIGVCNGVNFPDYPDGCQLILVDTNDKFEPMMRSYLAKFPTLNLEKYYIAEPEDMVEIPDGSVDAVVSQYALCSCKHEYVVIKEIQRILAPGGKYYFVEHVLDKKNIFRRMLQKLFVNTGILGIIGLGCNATRDMESALRKADFSALTVNALSISLKYNISAFVTGSNIFGVATK